MPKIKLYNNIAQIGLDQFTPNYEVNENMEDEDAILVRSANLHDIERQLLVIFIHLYNQNGYPHFVVEFT